MADISKKTASLVLPIFNEERYIESCVRSLLRQDYPLEEMEILLVDGMSTDRTMEILRGLEAELPDTVRVLENPKRIQAAAMNLGAKAARGEYLVRVDAHAEYPPSYVSTCIRLLGETGADNVGCAWITSARTEGGKIIAKALTSSFAVGGSGFRVDAPSGYADTVPFGAFRRDFYLSMGGIDERLARTEDKDLNYRIRKAGGKIYLTNEIHVTYYCRETLPALAKQAFGNGKWNGIGALYRPGSVSPKYFAPMAFVLSLAGMPALGRKRPFFRRAFAGELSLYLLLALASAGKKAERLGELPRIAAVFPVFHTAYGLGSLAGLWEFCASRKWRT